MLKYACKTTLRHPTTQTHFSSTPSLLVYAPFVSFFTFSLSFSALKDHSTQLNNSNPPSLSSFSKKDIHILKAETLKHTHIDTKKREKNTSFFIFSFMTEFNMMEWEKQGHPHPHHHHHHQHQQQQQEREEHQNGNVGNNIEVNGNGNGGMLYVKVMTDEQLETLRKQIALYASICEQLVEMHKNLTAQQDLAGVRLGNLYCDPLMTSAGHKITSRQRWTPTPVQLQILERIFDQGNGTPSKQKIKEITSELGQHGQISETNVYNWFQNRRARSKRKQQNSAPNNGESEVETEVDSPKDKKTKPEEFHSQQNSDPRAEDLCFQNPEISSDLHFLDPQSSKAEAMFPSDDGLKPARSLGQISFYEGLLSNPRNDHLTGKMEVPGNYGLYQHSEDYGM